MTNVITNLPLGPQNIHYIHIYKIQADHKLYINQDVNTRYVYVMLEMVFYNQEKEGSGQPTHSF